MLPARTRAGILIGMESHKPISTLEKARAINVSKCYFGTIAEIGAGQEISRWFFKVGGTAGTLAKAISAYDMSFSDAIYGPDPSGRYVVESRLKRMLNYEFDLLQNRSKPEIKTSRALFALANTVAAKSPRYKGDCHGWMGLKFQTQPESEANEIILHIRMLDSTNHQQQETLGTLGVNLLYAATHHADDIPAFLHSLIEGELKERIEINALRLSGPLFKNVDIYAANLQLVHFGLTPALLIREDGHISHLAEELYLKQVLLHRAEFNPITSSDMDMLLSARNHFCGSKTEENCAPFLLSEIYPEDWSTEAQMESLLHRIRMLLLAKQNILITSFKESFQLTDYLEKFTKDPIHFVYPTKKLVAIFEKDHFHSFESLARIFKEQTRMYFYPTPSNLIDPQFLGDPKAPYFTLQNYKPSDKNKLLFSHLLKEGYLEDINDHHCDASLLIGDKVLQKMIHDKDKKWTQYVPVEIAAYINNHKLYI
jgi:hypothetical protein